jgi:hypothetical protein
VTASKKAKAARYTKAQNKAFQAWQKAHPFTNQPARSGRPQPAGGSTGASHGSGGKHGHGKHGKGKHGLALPGTPGEPLCAATAVAVDLLLSTGKRASDDDIAALHTAAGGDGEGAAMQDVLTAVLRRGLAGMQLANVRKAPATTNLPGGIVASVNLEEAQAGQGTWEPEDSPWWGLHAIVLSDGHALSWGRAIPVSAGFLARQALAAWTLDWGGGYDDGAD